MEKTFNVKASAHIYARELEQLGRVAVERTIVKTTSGWASLACGLD
ncbi:MAG: hypothetical protein ACJ754_24600 [Pyrinomonadaceae bacterium]